MGNGGSVGDVGGDDIQSKLFQTSPSPLLSMPPFLS